jgi:periplasmic protein CpxP/Spy
MAAGVAAAGARPAGMAVDGMAVDGMAVDGMAEDGKGVDGAAAIRAGAVGTAAVVGTPAVAGKAAGAGMVAGASMAAGTETARMRCRQRLTSNDTRANMTVFATLRGAALAALILPAAAYAQTSAAPGTPAPGTPTPAAPAPATAAPALTGATAQAVNQRIDTLRGQLGITSAEMPAWDNFANIMRENAGETQSLFSQRAANASTMSAVENMNSYAEIARSYADNTQRLATAFNTLYTSLSPTQKQTADTLFRQQAETSSRQPARR